MSRVDPETFLDHELARVFITPSLREARRAEDLLTERGVDYTVRVEPCGRSLFGSPRHGAAFYVLVGQADYCRSHLSAAGLSLGVEQAELPGSLT